MATADPTPQVSTPTQSPGSGLLVVPAGMASVQLESLLANLSAHFPPQSLLVAAPADVAPDSFPALQFVAAPDANPAVTLTAADFASAHRLAEEHGAQAILMLGPDSGSLSGDAIRQLAAAVQAAGTDLAIPCYDLPPNAGLVNSAILYPLTRALFAAGARFPLAIDLGLSPRMAERLALAAQRFAATSQADSLVWPANEAALAGFSVLEIDAGERKLPQPTDPDVNAILAQVTGSLFADIEAKAAFWQRPRRPSAAHNFNKPYAPKDGLPDIAPMLEAFHLAYTNLREIWSLVLPPQSLLGLKRLSVAEPASFRMPENLWARIVYDFLLAYRLRTLNRGHLLGALIPLYLAWVASHINILASGVNPERHIEAVAAAFEAEKPYLVSRWRWPDRFNP